jgi:hypothetical protein
MVEFAENKYNSASAIYLNNELIGFLIEMDFNIKGLIC